MGTGGDWKYISNYNSSIYAKNGVSTECYGYIKEGQLRRIQDPVQEGFLEMVALVSPLNYEQEGEKEKGNSWENYRRKSAKV